MRFDEDKFRATLPKIQDTNQELETIRFLAHKATRPVYDKVPDFGTWEWEAWSRAYRKWLQEHEILQARLAAFGLWCSTYDIKPPKNFGALK